METPPSRPRKDSSQCTGLCHPLSHMHLPLDAQHQNSAEQDVHLKILLLIKCPGNEPEMEATLSSCLGEQFSSCHRAGGKMQGSRDPSLSPIHSIPNWPSRKRRCPQLSLSWGLANPGADGICGPKHQESPWGKGRLSDSNAGAISRGLPTSESRPNCTGNGRTVPSLSPGNFGFMG